MSIHTFAYAVVGVVLAFMVATVAMGVPSPPPEPVEGFHLTYDLGDGECRAHATIYPDAPDAGDRILVELGAETIVVREHMTELHAAVDRGATVTIYSVEFPRGWEASPEILVSGIVTDRCELLTDLGHDAPGDETVEGVTPASWGDSR